MALNIEAAVEENSGNGLFSLADLQELIAENGRVIQSFRVEGIVCAAVPKRRLIALQDESATALLELPAVNENFHPGDRIAIEGKNCSIIRGDFSIQLGTAPVVDNDGRHSAIIKSGKVFLQEGIQPVRLGWFNGYAEASLKLEWEGLGLPRQVIPNSVLCRQIPGVTNLSGAEPGLDFVAYNGDGHYVVDFEGGNPASHGIANNFDVSYRIRPEHTALFFSGGINIPRSGVYTFYVTSDDGSQLWVGEPSVSCARLGMGSAPVPATYPLNQTSEQSRESYWVELDGEVVLLGVHRKDLELELSVEGTRVPVKVLDGAALLSTNLLHEHVRVRGIGEFSSEERKLVGIVVPSLEQVDIPTAGTGDFGNADTNQLFESVAQVRQLKPEQLTNKYPAKIDGVLVGMRPAALMVEDATGGISVHFNTRDWAVQPHLGDLLEVEGVVAPGLFAPIIVANRVTRLGSGPMPEPIHPRWDQLLNGSLDCEYVEIQGILLAATQQDITVFTEDRTIIVGGIETDNLFGPSVSKSIPFVGSLVRLRGCFGPVTDNRVREVSRQKINLNSATLSLEELAPADPFSLPTEKIAGLLWFSPRASVLHRTKLAGQVIHAHAGEYLALEGQRGFRIRTAAPPDLQVGDLIEAVGFPNLNGPSPILQEAQIRKTGHAPLASPVPVSAQGILGREHDATLVQVEATLIGETTYPHERILEMQAGPFHFQAIMEPGPLFSKNLIVGSRLQLVGAYANSSANDAGRDSFSLFLINSFDSLKVLEQPTWWTPQHAATVAIFLMGTLGLALVWITLLRREVELRTAQLGKEIVERQRVEQEQAIEQERTRVAQDLHDELGASLTTVGLLGELAKNSATPAEKKTGYLEQITHLASSLVIALDEIVWAVNPQYDSIASSANYYAYFAQPFLNAAGLACRLDIAENYSEHRLDPRLRHGVFLAFKEALNNVVRHAQATEVRIKIVTLDSQLIITITDNGHGIYPSTNESAPSHNGIVGMQDRLSRLGGSCSIRSQAGSGTTVELRIPLPPLSSTSSTKTSLDTSDNKNNL